MMQIHREGIMCTREDDHTHSLAVSHDEAA
jgi:hypothetical protein